MPTVVLLPFIPGSGDLFAGSSRRSFSPSFFLADRHSYSRHCANWRLPAMICVEAYN
jgi:hypothetical protein